MQKVLSSHSQPETILICLIQSLLNPKIIIKKQASVLHHFDSCLIRQIGRATLRPLIHQGNLYVRLVAHVTHDYG